MVCDLAEVTEVSLDFRLATREKDVWRAGQCAEGGGVEVQCFDEL